MDNESRKIVISVCYAVVIVAIALWFVSCCIQMKNVDTSMFDHEEFTFDGTVIDTLIHANGIREMIIEDDEGKRYTIPQSVTYAVDIPREERVERNVRLETIVKGDRLRVHCLYKNENYSNYGYKMIDFEFINDKE